MEVPLPATAPSGSGGLTVELEVGKWGWKLMWIRMSGGGKLGRQMFFLSMDRTASTILPPYPFPVNLAMLSSICGGL